MTNLSAEDTVLALAATVTTRSCELLSEGWTKGKMRGGAGGVENFCIHGAIELAMEELFGGRNLSVQVQRDVEDVAVMFICHEAFGEARVGGIPAAAYNDAAARKHGEVVGVMERAADRLWSLAVDWDADETFVPSKWADVDVQSEQAQQYLHAALA